jgi:uncharacterized protein YbjT (DUF2867 family)
VLIAVLGATGQAGSKVVEALRADGHEAVAASRSSGVDVLTGKGLGEALAGADAVIDITNPPSFEDGPVMEFFGTSAGNLVEAARAAGVGHVVVLSIVGVDGLQASGYMRAKLVQECTLSESGLPFTIVRATQFHEFTPAIVASLLVEDEVRVPDALIQPIAVAAVGSEVVRIALGAARNGIVDVGGPEKLTFADMAAMVLAASGDGTPVVVDPTAVYFGAPLHTTSLVTGDSEMLAGMRLEDWLRYR